MASTEALVFVTISWNAPPAAISCSRVAPSGVPAPAPSWYSATMTSASLPSVIFLATRLTASTGSPKSSMEMPEGVTRVGVSCVMAPMTATFTPLRVMILYSSSTGVVVPLAYTLAPR